MLDHFRGLAVFVKVAQTGSFAAAARELRLAPSVVSHHVTQLETRLGVVLLYRSTRSLSLTGEGHSLLPFARKMVASAEEALDAVAVTGDQLTGSLKITMPAFAEKGPLHQIIWDFALANPSVHLTVHQTDRRPDMIAEGFDLAIRFGALRDSALKSRRIGDFERKLVCAPAYLAGIGPLHRPEDLRRCDYIGLSMIPDVYHLIRDGEQVEIVPEMVRIQVDSVTAAKSAALAGLGIQRLPLSEVEEDIARGALVELLPDWSPPMLGIHAVWPDTGKQRRLTRRLIDHLVEQIQMAQHQKREGPDANTHPDRRQGRRC
ncbi:MAG: LysR family transcriptional regulator [Pseudomonadota bacterium]